MRISGTCFVCDKKDGGVETLCDCDPGEVCDICRDQLTTCQDCGVPYCGACFHKPEHSLCTPPEQDHPEHKRVERRWCGICKREARAQLLFALVPGAMVGESKRDWAAEGWPEVEPDTEENFCFDGCKGRGFHWADPLLGGFHGNIPFICCCTLRVV